MAPDGFPSELIIAGRRFVLRIDGNTCCYAEQPRYISETYRICDTTSFFGEIASNYTNIGDCFNYVDEETLKIRRLRWLRFIRGPAWQTPRRWPTPRNHLPYFAPSTAILQPRRWANRAKPKLPPEIRRIRTELKRLRQPRTPRSIVCGALFRS